jgi:hypothetical protein
MAMMLVGALAVINPARRRERTLIVGVGAVVGMATIVDVVVGKVLLATTSRDGERVA